MTSKLKTKVSIGVLFLFTLQILVGVTGFFYLNKIISDQQNILKDNYETIDYTKNMLQALDSAKGIQVFEANLKKQEGNITEPGEKEATEALRKHFDLFVQHTDSTKLLIVVRNDINLIMQINLNAILSKNKQVGAHSDDAKLIITLLITICGLIGFTFSFNFPGYIADPIVKLTQGIKAIAGKKYTERIHLNRNDEFGEMATAFNQMAEELDKYEHSNLAKILFEKQRAETVINSLQDASIGIDGNGTILFANLQALQLLNLQETEVVGRKVSVLSKTNDLFRFLMEERSTQPFKIVIDAKEQFFSKEIVSISNAEGTLGNMIVLKNITPFKEKDVAKTNFMATISHELKTPLASSDFSLKLLDDERVGTLNKEQKDLVAHLKEDNQRLLKIISELLDLSQIESGRIQLNIVEVLPAIPVQKALDAVFVSAQQKNVMIESKLDDSIPLVRADAEKVTWVLINFLTNAIKHSTEKSKILIQVRLVSDNVSFEVIDQGKGISPIYVERIFERFFQIPGTEKSGNGLGLSICKEFIEAMGGKIGVKSEEGKGSCFFFYLPRIKTD